MAPHRQEGFTALEALLAAAVMSVVVVAALLFFSTNTGAYRVGQVRAEGHQNARIGLDEMEREIRVAGYDLSGRMELLATPTAVQTAQAGQVAFVAELNGNAALDQVTYRLAGDQIVRDFASWNGASFGAATTGVVADGVSSLAFQYFTAADAALVPPLNAAELATVARITVSVTTTDTAAQATATFPLTVDIRLRNHP